MRHRDFLLLGAKGAALLSGGCSTLMGGPRSEALATSLPGGEAYALGAAAETRFVLQTRKLSAA